MDSFPKTPTGRKIDRKKITALAMEMLGLKENAESQVTGCLVDHSPFGMVVDTHPQISEQCFDDNCFPRNPFALDIVSVSRKKCTQILGASSSPRKPFALDNVTPSLTNNTLSESFSFPRHPVALNDIPPY
uniref:Uncharacterized protein n=1 Tax=Branchiostoma floridae TaxID=7739 RepID=C3ZBS3_BRAFL|eukprot:XP_002594299.1 hypothetical protein BRAFLDRAFT_65156 [Branchiostoma floridae]